MSPTESIEEARDRLRARLAPIVGEGAIGRLEEALTHPSFGNETSMKDNQRLEFLGDAVLGLCVSEMLSTTHPEADEGELTRMRSALVNAEALAQWGREVELGACLALGRGVRAGAEREQTNVLADAVEAVVAAVYEALGLAAARALVREVTRGPFADAERLVVRDPKSALQERVQAEGKGSPRYRVIASEGPAHDPTFEVEVLVDDAVLARGRGRSKRQAERAAASSALESLGTRDALPTEEER